MCSLQVVQYLVSLYKEKNTIKYRITNQQTISTEWGNYFYFQANLVLLPDAKQQQEIVKSANRNRNFFFVKQEFGQERNYHRDWQNNPAINDWNSHAYVDTELRWWTAGIEQKQPTGEGNHTQTTHQTQIHTHWQDGGKRGKTEKAQGKSTGSRPELWQILKLLHLL